MKLAWMAGILVVLAAPLGADSLGDVRADIAAVEQRIGRLLEEVRAIGRDIDLARRDQEAARAPIRAYEQYQTGVERMEKTLRAAQVEKRQVELLLGWHKEFTGWNPVEYVSSYLLTNWIPDERQGYLDRHRAAKDHLRKAEADLAAARESFEARLRGEGVPVAPGAGGAAAEDRVFAPSLAALRRRGERSAVLLQVREAEIDLLQTLLRDRQHRIEQEEEALRDLRTRERGLLTPDRPEPPSTPPPPPSAVDVPPGGGPPLPETVGRMEWATTFAPSGSGLQENPFGTSVTLVLHAPPGLGGQRHLRILVAGRGAFHAWVDLPPSREGVGLLQQPVQHVLHPTLPLPFGRFSARVEMLDAPGIAPDEATLERPLHDPSGRARRIQEERRSVEAALAQVRAARGAEQVGERRRNLAGRYGFLAQALNAAGEHEEAWSVAARGLEEARAAGRIDVSWSPLYEAQATAAYFLNRPDPLRQAVRAHVEQLSRPAPSWMGTVASRRRLQAQLLGTLAEQLFILGRPVAECANLSREALGIDPTAHALSDDTNLMRVARARGP